MSVVRKFDISKPFRLTRSTTDYKLVASSRSWIDDRDELRCVVDKLARCHDGLDFGYSAAAVDCVARSSSDGQLFGGLNLRVGTAPSTM